MPHKLTIVPNPAKDMFLAHYMHISKLMYDAYVRSYPVTARETYVKSQRALMPDSLIAFGLIKAPQHCGMQALICLSPRCGRRCSIVPADSRRCAEQTAPTEPPRK